MIPQTLQECFEIASDLEKVGCYRFAETLDHILESAIQQNRRTAARGVFNAVDAQAIVGRFAQVMSDPFFVMGIRPDSTPEQMNQAMQKMHHHITQLKNTNPARAKQLQEIWIKSLRRLSNPESFASEAKIWYPHMKVNTPSASGDAANAAGKVTNIAEEAAGDVGKQWMKSPAARKLFKRLPWAGAGIAGAYLLYDQLQGKDDKAGTNPTNLIPQAPVASQGAQPVAYQQTNADQSAPSTNPLKDNDPLKYYLGWGFDAAKRKGVPAARAALQHHLQANTQSPEFVQKVMQAFESQIASQKAFQVKKPQDGAE